MTDTTTQAVTALLRDLRAAYPTEDHGPVAHRAAVTLAALLAERDALAALVALSASPAPGTPAR